MQRCSCVKELQHGMRPVSSLRGGDIMHKRICIQACMRALVHVCSPGVCIRCGVYALHACIPGVCMYRRCTHAALVYACIGAACMQPRCVHACTLHASCMLHLDARCMHACGVSARAFQTAAAEESLLLSFSCLLLQLLLLPSAATHCMHAFYACMHFMHALHARTPWNRHTLRMHRCGVCADVCIKLDFCF